MRNGKTKSSLTISVKLRGRPRITARSCWLGYGGGPESYPSRLRAESQIGASGGAQSQFGYSLTGPKVEQSRTPSYAMKGIANDGGDARQPGLSVRFPV